MLRHIKRRGFRISAFSHIPKEWGEYLLSKFGLDKLFDDVFLSGVHIFTKCDKSEYVWLLGELGNPSECWFIDDMLDDLSQAHEAGIKTIWLKKRAATNAFKPDKIVFDVRIT